MVETQLEPPYGVISNQIMAGKVIPFLGAGASFVGRTPNVEWDRLKPSFLPSGSELAAFLADETSFPSRQSRRRDDLPKVASYYVDLSGRRVLRERLRKVFNRDYAFGTLHQYLASIPVPLLFVVTNYDTLLEQAFQAAGKPYDLVIYPADRKEIANAILWWRHGVLEPEFTPPNELFIDLTKTTVIFKMHGTIQKETPKWDNLVITEEDYVEFLSRMTANTAIPSIFYEQFRQCSFLFMGYSLGDWNLRVILKNLSKYFIKRGRTDDEDTEILPSWAIQYRPSELERTLWERRNVNIFDITIDEFVLHMLERSS
jgi:hypothetical protein